MKSKVGIIFFTAGWFREVGLQQESSTLTGEVESIAEEIIRKIANFCEPVFDGIITTEADSKRYTELIKSTGVDALIISPLMWSEDILLKTLLKNLPDIPIIFCTFMPYDSFKDFLSFDEMLKGSGTVGSLQMSGFLRRQGINYEPVIGFYRDDDVYLEIKNHLDSILISRRLRELNIGILPYRCDQMTTTYVDEFCLNSLYGIELKYLELEDVRKIAQSFGSKEIEDLRALLNKLGFSIEVDDSNLTEAIKYSLALEKIVKEHKLKALAINDIIDEMHDCFGLRPCLVNPRLTEFGINVSMEADIAAVIAMYVLNEFTGQKPFYSEILCADLKENNIIMGHAGYYEYENADPGYPVRIISDPEYKTTDRFSGACLYYKYKPGPVTIINSVYDNERIRWTVTEGQSLEGPPKFEGDPHVHCKLDIALKDFFKENMRNGVSQHWIVLFGHLADDLEIVCRWNNFGYIKIS